jgi:hypothetical protein
MAGVQMVTAIGDIEIDIDVEIPTSATLRVPFVLQDGEELVLALETPEMRRLWEFLSTAHQQWPAVFRAQ